MCVGFLNFIYFLSISRTKHWKTYFVKWFKQRKHIFNFLLFFFSQFYAKVSDYRAVGLSSRRTIDTHPILELSLFIVPRYMTSFFRKIALDSRIETLWMEIIHIINRRKSVWSCLYFCVDCARLIITKKLNINDPVVIMAEILQIRR